ncbi:transposase [Streptomyces sp. AK010]|uniref:IS110 family transposase n=1 Tax=Streptomyces sp. AK010 TaxID=2723074 RepID=UPI0028932C6A|nr:transposase [Streptomyces sp. AK010]
MSERRARGGAGVDAGNGHHWAAVADEAGATLWSKKIDNDETAILTAMGEIPDLADEVSWAVDISGTSSALLPALLAANGQRAVYVQAVIALARRRAGVLWALLRDGRVFTSAPPVTQAA